MIQVYTLWFPLLVLRFSRWFGRVFWNMTCCVRNAFDLVALEHDAVGSLYLSWIVFFLEDLPVVRAWKMLHVCLRTWLTALYCLSPSLVLIRVKSAKCLGVISLLETEDSIVLRFPCCLCTGSLPEESNGCATLVNFSRWFLGRVFGIMATVVFGTEGPVVHSLQLFLG